MVSGSSICFASIHLRFVKILTPPHLKSGEIIEHVGKMSTKLFLHLIVDTHHSSLYILYLKEQTFKLLKILHIVLFQKIFIPLSAMVREILIGVEGVLRTEGFKGKCEAEARLQEGGSPDYDKNL